MESTELRIQFRTAVAGGTLIVRPNFANQSVKLDSMAHFMFSGNVLPKAGPDRAGDQDRLAIVPWSEARLEDANETILEELAAELPDILSLILAMKPGAIDLRQPPSVMVEAKAEYVEDQDELTQRFEAVGLTPGKGDIPAGEVLELLKGGGEAAEGASVRWLTAQVRRHPAYGVRDAFGTGKDGRRYKLKLITGLTRMSAGDGTPSGAAGQTLPF